MGGWTSVGLLMIIGTQPVKVGQDHWESQDATLRRTF